MTWWAWLGVFVLLVVLAAVVLFLQARQVWRAGVRLFDEIGAASDRLAEVTGGSGPAHPGPSGT